MKDREAGGIAARCCVAMSPGLIPGAGAVVHFVSSPWPYLLLQVRFIFGFSGFPRVSKTGIFSINLISGNIVRSVLAPIGQLIMALRFDGLAFLELYVARYKTDSYFQPILIPLNH